MHESFTTIKDNLLGVLIPTQSNLVATHTGHEYLLNIVALLTAAVLVVMLFRYFRLSPVLGYLVAGAAIGEHGLNYINSKEVEFIAEFGIVFLLFIIGVELTIEKLMAMKLHVFGFGTLQTLLTGIVIGSLAYCFEGINANTAIVIGGIFALSSTAIVMSVIITSGRKATQVGRLSIAVLLLQDLAVVPLILIISLMVNTPENVEIIIISTIFKALIGVLCIFFIGKIILRPLFQLIVSTNNDELFVATTLLIVLGTSLVTEYIGLSMALGAFIAGLLVAETQYSYQVEETISPFKGLFMGLFFMSVGMRIDLEFVASNLSNIMTMSLILIIIKAGIIIFLCRIFGFSKGASIQSGLLLAQGSEFAFIMIAIAQEASLIPHSTTQILMLVVTTTMALTPLMSNLGIKLSNKINSSHSSQNDSTASQFKDLTDHVIICGYGKVGKIVSYILSEHNIHYLCIDYDKIVVNNAYDAGVPIYNRDATKLENLSALNLETASCMVITVSNKSVVRKIIQSLGHLSGLSVIVSNEEYYSDLEQDNVDFVHEKYETGIKISSNLMQYLSVCEDEIANMKKKYRANNYHCMHKIVNKRT